MAMVLLFTDQSYGTMFGLSVPITNYCFMIRFLLSKLLVFATVLLSVSVFAQVKFVYLGQYNAQGVPEYLEDTSDVIGQDFLNDINAALPDKKPVPQYNPQYISLKSETDIVLDAQTDLWVTFAFEAAGYNNALGFYTYNPASPPKTITDIKTHTLIFPNVSFSNSGGGLRSGDKVYIGKFDANTAVGWFVVADAFKNGKMTQGKYIVYSEPVLNPEKASVLQSHTVLLNDTKRGKLVLGFEDVLRDQGSDQDFNDIVFYITASTYSAIKTEEVVPINSDVVIVSPPVIIPPVLADTTKKGTTPGNTGSSGTQNTNSTDNNNNININTNVSNTNTSTGNNTNNTTTNNNVNTGTQNTTNNNSNSNNTTVINNTTIINNNGGGNRNNHRNNSNVTPAPNGNTGINGSGLPNSSNSNTVNSNVTVCNRNGLSPEAFEKLKTQLRTQKVESNKAMIIRQAVANKKVTVSQVKQIIKFILVEQYKLEQAKFLFEYTCDKSNYFELNSLLSASRARELDAFLKDKSLEDENVTSINTSVTTDGNTTSTNNTTDVQNNGVITNCDNGRMPAEEFDDIKESIKSKSFTSDQMAVLKEAMPTRCISSTQVKEVMGLFSFETDKLAVSKYLYKFTSDKNNYYKVNDAFSFSSSIDDLKKFINTGK